MSQVYHMILPTFGLYQPRKATPGCPTKNEVEPKESSLSILWNFYVDDYQHHLREIEPVSFCWGHKPSAKVTMTRSQNGIKPTQFDNQFDTRPGQDTGDDKIGCDLNQPVCLCTRQNSSNASTRRVHITVKGTQRHKCCLVAPGGPSHRSRKKSSSYK